MQISAYNTEVYKICENLLCYIFLILQHILLITINIITKHSLVFLKGCVFRVIMPANGLRVNHYDFVALHSSEA